MVLVHCTCISTVIPLLSKYINECMGCAVKMREMVLECVMHATVTAEDCTHSSPFQFAVLHQLLLSLADGSTTQHFAV